MTDIREQRARVFVLTARPDDTGMVPIHPDIVSDLLDLLNEARAGTFVAEPMCVCRTDAFGCGSWDCIIKPAAQEPPASTSTDVKDGRCQKCGGFPLLDECGCLSGPWQEPPAKGGDR